MGKIKGESVRSKLEFIRQTYGSERLQQMLTNLDTLDREILSNPILPISP